MLFSRTHISHSVTNILHHAVQPTSTIADVQTALVGVETILAPYNVRLPELTNEQKILLGVQPADVVETTATVPIRSLSTGRTRRYGLEHDLAGGVAIKYFFVRYFYENGKGTITFYGLPANLASAIRIYNVLLDAYRDLWCCHRDNQGYYYKCEDERYAFISGITDKVRARLKEFNRKPFYAPQMKMDGKRLVIDLEATATPTQLQDVQQALEMKFNKAFKFGPSRSIRVASKFGYDYQKGLEAGEKVDLSWLI